MTESEGAGDRFQRLTQYHRDREPVEPPGPVRRPPLCRRQPPYYRFFTRQPYPRLQAG